MVNEEKLREAYAKTMKGISQPSILGGGPRKDSVLKVVTYDEGDIRMVLVNDGGMLVFCRDGRTLRWERPESMPPISRRPFMPVPKPIFTSPFFDRYRTDV